MAEDQGPKRMPIAEFRELGVLQEANRLFFHPLGLALEVVQEECEECWGHGDLRRTYGPDDPPSPCGFCGGTGRKECLGGIWDYRDDSEGMVFGPGMIDRQKVEQVLEMRMRHIQARVHLFGHGGIQPLDGEWDESRLVEVERKRETQ